ncbi:NAD(P)H-dependent oxidoreductase [Luteolibacter arcticus]|uniref:NAD(P)H-dependent oxidoreductase n=1 Tax=Luteolibacter arcticus TaxID=1581411 RepID=A0ABT3GQW8_9BACT|nr:NAD(P)H-dependent oxidoreductase [Luteolibacter arcticus]MCW1925882.1 NAD(P)H-dependent oxidoreductase [Luteolibacter arcticus]
MPKLLILPGSARRGSVNCKLAAVAAQLATEAGAEVELIDSNDYELPLFNQDLEDAEGLPPAAKELKAKFTAADAIVFVSPEYNSSITPLMKNFIDWVSRTETDDEPSLSAYRGKVAGLLSASPGALGGLRALVHLRSILGNIGVLVVPKQFALSGAPDKFDESGKLTDDSALKSVRGVIRDVISLATKLA